MMALDEIRAMNKRARIREMEELEGEKPGDAKELGRNGLRKKGKVSNRMYHNLSRKTLGRGGY